MLLQRTIRKKAEVQGVGLHTGAPSRMTFAPAPEGTGVYFVRNDLPGKPALFAHARSVQATQMATVLGGDAFSVSTVEHCLSAVAALGIDNLFIELEGPEIPIVDGSAMPFFKALRQVGTVEQSIPRKYLYVHQAVYYGDADKHAYVMPYNGLRITCTIDFPHPKIGEQVLDIEINEYSFERDIAGARTFGFLKDVEALRAKGLARGGSLENAIVLDNDKIMNAEGLRFADEFVRHKILDALGDLTTLGHPLLGHLVLYKAGHDTLHKLVTKIIESPECYRWIELMGDLPPETFISEDLTTQTNR